MIKIMRVNMSNLSIINEDVPDRYMNLGGRAITSQILCDEVDPKVYPLGEGNKLVIAPGLLTGTMAPSSGRLSIGSKSPLTGGIKESNAGGTAATTLAALGIKAIIVEGKPTDCQKFILKVSDKTAELIPADELSGFGNYQTVGNILSKYQDIASVISIGQAGEQQLATATVAVTDMDKKPCRHCGRGGMGAVMGSKGLKAIILEKAIKKPLGEIMDGEGFKVIAREWSKKLVEERKVLTNFGTAITMNFINSVGGLPTHNFSYGQFEGVERINGTALAERIKTNGGKAGHACSPGCVIRCSNVYNDSQGEYVTSGFEYETLCLLGSNCDIDDIDAIARFDRLCDDFGIDTMEIGCAVAVLMEAGVIQFGDAAGTERIIREIAEGTPLGRVVGQGTAVVGKVYNVERVPVVKGQGLPSYDPRVAKGTGVTYATSPMGADHTAGNIIPGRYGVDNLKPEGQVGASRLVQTYTTVIDSMGLCLFVGAVEETIETIARLLSKMRGQTVTSEELLQRAEQTIMAEIEFNRRSGMTANDDRLPEFFKVERISSQSTVFDVEDGELDQIFADKSA